MKDIINIAVLVSGGGTNLGALIKAQEKGILKSGRIKAVISSNPDAYALCRAEKAGIPGYVVSKKECASSAEFEEKIVKIIEEQKCRLIILAGFMSILGKNFTDKYKNRIINIHPSLIPSFCGSGYYGLRVHKAALEKGVKVSGATVHYVNDVPDGGEIIMQKAVKVYEGDTPEILQKRIMRLAEWKILPQASELVCRKLQNERE